jgi:hypothetical protein
MGCYVDYNMDQSFWEAHVRPHIITFAAKDAGCLENYNNLIFRINHINISI